MRLECPIHGIVPREETVKGYEITKDDYVRFEPDELKALEQASSSALVIDSFVPERAIDPVYFEDTYYLGAGKNGGRGHRCLPRPPEDAPDRRWHVHLRARRRSHWVHQDRLPLPLSTPAAEVTTPRIGQVRAGFSPTGFIRHADARRIKA